MLHALLKSAQKLSSFPYIAALAIIALIIASLGPLSTNQPIEFGIYVGIAISFLFILLLFHKATQSETWTIRLLAVTMVYFVAVCFVILIWTGLSLVVGWKSCIKATDPSCEEKVLTPYEFAQNSYMSISEATERIVTNFGWIEPPPDLTFLPDETNILIFSATAGGREAQALEAEIKQYASWVTVDIEDDWKLFRTMKATRIYYLKPRYRSVAKELGKYLPGTTIAMSYDRQSSDPEYWQDTSYINVVGIEPHRDLVIFAGSGLNSMISKGFR